MFMALGFTGMFSTQLLYILAIYCANPVLVAVFLPAMPVWTTLLAIITKIEPHPPLDKVRGWAKILGIFLAVAGAVTMVMEKFKESADNTKDKSAGEQFLGCIFILGSTLTSAVYILLQKKFIFKQSNSIWKSKPVTVTAWSYCFGAAFLGLSSLYYVDRPEKFTSFPKQQVYPLLYAIFIASALCYLLITWCNMQISSSVASASWPLQTLFSAVLSYIFLGDVMEPIEYIGGVLIILGLVAVVWSNYAEEKELYYKDNNLCSTCSSECQSTGAGGYIKVPTIEDKSD